MCLGTNFLHRKGMVINMAFCRYCGKPLEEGVRFCGNCGANIENGASSENAHSAAETAAPYTPPPDGEYDPKDVENTKVVCAISYIGILFFIPLLAYPNSRFAKFHANQALIVFLLSIAMQVICSVGEGIWWALPFLPNFVENLGGWAFDLAEWLIPLAAGICGFVNALNGKAKEIPIIGKFNLINK